MFLANTLKVLVVIATLLQPCHAMRKSDGGVNEGKSQASPAAPKTEATHSGQKFVYSGLFAQQLEKTAKRTCYKKCCLCMCIVLWGGTAGIEIASLITKNTLVQEVCGSIAVIVLCVPGFNYVNNLDRKKFANTLRTTCKLFIDSNNLGAISEYLFMLSFCDMFKKSCDASLSWSEQASVIHDYLKSNGCSCSTEVTLQHDPKTGDQLIVMKSVWSAKKEA